VLAFLVNYFTFHPAKAADFWQAPPPDLRVEDVELVSPHGTRIHAWWTKPPNWSVDKGALLYCHGNAGNLSLRGSSVLNWQRALDVAVLIFDYPGYGRSTGRPSEAGCYAAGDAAYTWLTATAGVPQERVIIYGGSLGGAVALDLAVRRSHRATVLVSAFASLREMARMHFPWLPSRLAGGSFDNLSKVGRTGRPVFIAHGNADRIVSFSHGERLFAAAAEPKRFYPMHGRDHNEPPGPDCLAAVREFLEQYAP
jgi:fermentation-respiration switch protein FrsA (DUF1100 family)